MELSLRLILSELGFEADVHLEPEEDPAFNSVELYSPKEQETGENKLLVCTLSEALSAPRREGLYFLCVRDRMVDDCETPETLHGVTIIRRNMELRELFNRAQRVFMSVLNWVLDMERSVSANHGLQELLTLSEPILKNHISVMDSTFKLLAYTSNIETDDPVTNDLIKYGYHPQKTVALLQKLRRIEEYKKSRDLIVSDDYETSRYVVVKKTFHLGGTVSIIVVMVCCNREVSEGLLELFRLLLDYIRVYVERDFAYNSGSNAQKALVKDLITKNVGSPEEAKARAMYAGLPFEESFCLAVLVFFDEDNTPLGQLVASLSGAFPKTVVFSDERHILLLDIGNDMEQSLWEETVGRLVEIDKFRCGISNVFHRLWDISVAYEQAILAVSTAERLNLNCAGQEAGHFCQFKDYWLYHILAGGVQASPAVYKSSFLFSSLDKLRKYDEAHHTNTLELLRVYLECERKATIVSSKLHMHRNTVLYNIGKIENILSVSLDDPDVRLKLLLAYKADDFGPNRLVDSV